MRVLNRSLAVALLLAGACTDVATNPTVPLGPPPAPRAAETSNCDPLTAIIPCADEPIGPVFGWPFFAPVNDVIYEAPGDPSPGTPGVWLGASVSPATCFNDRTLSIIDADHDWLDDRCELELARGFAPRWSMGNQDMCPDGEPAWAAKYFPNVGTVRIAFMPAYYDDCGPGDTFLNIGAGHPGDSEFTMVEVAFNAATQHWEFRGMWLSAHYGSKGGDRSQWVSPVDANFSRGYLDYPYIAVSANKHANYKSDSKCNNTFAASAGFGESCYGSMLTPFRFPIDPARNAGSRFTDLMGCVASIKRFAGNGRTECFYARKSFAGWHTGASGVTPYADFLNSDKFENRFGYWGPGPAPYNPAPPPVEDPPPPFGGCPDPTQIICT